MTDNEATGAALMARALLAGGEDPSDVVVAIARWLVAARGWSYSAAFVRARGAVRAAGLLEKPCG